MRTSRLVSIVLLLQVRGRVTAQALADEFEVSLRTVYRDIDQLSAAGVPVYADRGPGGGFALLDGYRTDLTGMTRAEAEALSIAGVPGAAVDLGLAEQLRTAQLKLVAALPDTAADTSRIGARLHIDTVDWYRRPAPTPHLPLLASAVWDQKRVAMQYQGWDVAGPRSCDPLGLVLKAGDWYLVARARTQTRIYKVANMSRLEVLDETFERPRPFELAAEWTRLVARFERGLLKQHATLKVTRRGVERLDRLGAAAAAQAKIGPFDANGWCEVTLPVEAPDIAAGQLLTFGAEVRVLEPEVLRDALRRQAIEIAELNRR
ncbi:helix-turn-helix transcriptional regulator [Paraburkholderia phosphatilytica]|uniref:helix-turn-helix transcriptional regulator n=1 Tax=Paraburkholderia phosphatilytica TaxID=2282883 RepID=UPI000E49AA6B|nr:YafY family protein [Paraburkholderia phosphatilytica]